MQSADKFRPYSRLVFWCAVVVLGINLLVGYRVHSKEAEDTGEAEAFEKVRVMMRAMHLIRQNYVDPAKVDYTTLIYNAIRGMAAGLDPFSGFMPAEDLKDMMDSTEGQFGGIGIRVTIRDELLTVIAPMPNTPGARAGILAGDQILKVDGESTKGLSMADCVQLLKGAPGTKVALSIRRAGREEPLEVTVERAIIEVPSVKDARILRDHIGYVRITQFNEPTGGELMASLKELQKQGARALILDVRNNPGGLLGTAVQVCGFFLPRGKLVVSTEGRRESQKQEYHTSVLYNFPRLPMVVLINQGSASASEIVAGCLRDWRRAMLVGEKTFGKGSVQNIQQLPDGSALRLTSAMYYTPSRRVIHENGIEPDIKVELTEAEQRALADFHYEHMDTQAPVPGEPGAPQDRQLERALEALQVYTTLNRMQSAKFKAPREPEPEPTANP